MIPTRAEPRYEVRATVEVVGDGPHPVQNLSLGGVCLQHTDVQEVGTVVDLVIHFPDLDGAQLSVRGVVAWVNREEPTDMGIHFLDLDDQRRQMLREFLVRVAVRQTWPAPDKGAAPLK